MPDFAEEEKLVQLSGSGGGGKGGGDRKPEEEKDNLFSRAEANVLLAIAEGPIEGFAESEKQSIYLNDTPIENEKGDDNFEGTIDISFKDGQVSQIQCLASKMSRLNSRLEFCVSKAYQCRLRQRRTTCKE